MAFSMGSDKRTLQLLCSRRPARCRLLEKSSATRGLWSSAQRKLISSFSTWDVRQRNSRLSNTSLCALIHVEPINPVGDGRGRRSHCGHKKQVVFMIFFSPLLGWPVSSAFWPLSFCRYRSASHCTARCSRAFYRLLLDRPRLRARISVESVSGRYRSRSRAVGGADGDLAALGAWTTFGDTRRSRQ